VTVARYVEGLPWLAVVGVALVAPAVRWRRRLCPGWTWVPSRLVEAVLAWSAIVVVCEALGALGWFTPWPVLVVVVAAGAGAWLLAPQRRPETAIGHEPTARWEPPVAVAFGGFVFAQWCARTVAAFGAGMTDVDTLSYHLPHAARFMQEGWLTRLHFIAPDEASAYNPSNGELAHSLGMLAWHRDPLSLVLNLGWLVLLLGAAWCIGRRLGSGAIAVGAVSVVLASPLIASTQAASGMTDTASVCFLLVAAYLLIVATDAPAALPLAGLAGGLALGSKFTIVVPFVALSVLVVVGARRFGRPAVTTTAAWLAPAFLTGSFWYLRNIARVGTPIPTLRIGVDGVRLPKPPIALERYAFTVAHYLFDGTIWSKWFLPGLRHAFGVLWPVVLVVALAAAVGALVRGGAVIRGLGAVALASGLAYLFTQTTAFGPPGQPVLFTANLRYLLPTLTLALALLPTVAGRRLPRGVMAGAVGALLLVTGLAPNAWPSDDRLPAVGLGVLGAVLALALLWTLRRPAHGRRAAWGAGIVVAVVVVLGFPATRHYEERRYTVAASSQVALDAWANGVHHAKIGIVGFFVQYPLYGSDLSNRVQYIGDFRQNHAFTDFRTCASWRRAVSDGGYRFVVISPSFPSEPDPAALAWTRDARGTTRVLVNDRTYVFRVDGRLDAATCPR